MPAPAPGRLAIRSSRLCHDTNMVEEQTDYSQPPPPPPRQRPAIPRVLLVLLILGAVLIVGGGSAVLYNVHRINGEMSRIMKDVGDGKLPDSQGE